MSKKYDVDTDPFDQAVHDAFDTEEEESNKRVTQQDIDFVLSVMSKEAPYDKQSIKQIFYGMLSAFTKIILHHAISSKNTGAGKTYILVLVAGYIPKKYVISLNGMSDKAMLHKAGIMVVENDNGMLEPLDTIIDRLEDSKEGVTDKKKLREINNEIKAFKQRAEKLIVLENKIILLLDTTQDGMFNALMSMVSQDTKEDQKYEYVDSNGSSVATRSNRFRGVPAIFTCQVVDDSRQVRYAEKNRRFIHVIPDTSKEKIHTAMGQVGFRCGLLPEEYDQEVVSDDDKYKAQEICSRLVEKLIEHSSHFENKQSGIKIFFPLSISNSIVKEPNDVWCMTVAERIFKYLTIITKMNMDSRPRLIDTVIPGKFYPISTFDDVKEALELMGLASSTLRPYIVYWYNNVFLPCYKQLQGEPYELLSKRGYLIEKETLVGVNTQQLADKTAQVMHVHKPNSKTLLQQYLYPLLNVGVIDKFRSAMDSRSYIYTPAEEGNINTLFSDPEDKRLEVFDPSHYPCKQYLEDCCRTIKEYSSKGGEVGTYRYRLVDSKGFDITYEELIDRFLSNPEVAFKESVDKTVPPTLEE